MKSLPNAQRYTGITKVFHWSIAILIVLDFCLAISFSQFNPGDRLYFPVAYAMHMTVGMTGLLLSVVFVVRHFTWGRARRTEASNRDTSMASRVLARIVHELLYAFMIVVPLTGWAVLSVRKKPAVLLGSVNWPNIGFLSDLPRAQRVVLHDWLLPNHTKLAYIGMGLVGLHFLAALYHHFLRRDDVLRRMLPATTKDGTQRTQMEKVE